MTTPNEGRGKDPRPGTQPTRGEEPHVVVRDRRRIDPETGQVRPPSAVDEAADGDPGPGADTGAPGSPAEVPDDMPEDMADDGQDELRAQVAERTADLQRLTAEYANYRRRVERDREVVVSSAKAGLATELLSVLDDVERAAAHGDLTGAFKAVADKLVAVLQRSGLEPFGQDGEPFDPSVHEAVQHDTSPDVTGPTVTAVLRRGYRFGDRVVRAALVGVTDHEPGGGPAAGGGPEADVIESEIDGESVGPHGTSGH